MKRSFRGYTIVEAMITLAIAGVMLTTVSVLLGGTRSNTEFTQGMRDLDSKLQTVINNVKAGSFTFPNDYKCRPQGSPPRAKLSAITGSDPKGEGVNQDCLHLGKAVQFVDGKNTAYIYTVLGIRTYTNASGEKIPVTSFDATNPEPAIASTGPADLTETYKIATGGALFKASGSSYNGTSNRSDMAGFYYDLSNSSAGTTSVSQPLLAKAYNNFQSNTIPGNQQSGVQTCIEQVSCSSPVLTSWKICFRSVDAKQTAYINVTVSSEGINTKLIFNNC